MAHMTQEEYQQNKKDVYFTTGILAVVTVVEVGLSILFEKYIGDPRWILMVFVTLASLVKAYWIMKVFMHVGHEKKGFIFTILFPFVFLVWAILAFALDGLHYFEMREILNGIFY
ncbi:MAG: cytochrome C oxidase subunit IV family protein [Chitinophagales bacterium]|nr:cytochrome C oxidase subunit IV family protein [Chitinophagales bacterium]